MSRGSTGSNDGQIWSLEAKHDRQITRHHIDDDARNKEWGDFTRTASKINIMGSFNHWQTANTRTDVYADTFCIKIPTSNIVNTRVFYRLDGCCHTVMDKGIHTTSVFGGDVLRDVETLYLTRYL